MNTQDYPRKQTYFCYVVDRVVNTNPYLFDSDGNNKDVNKKVWVARQVYPMCMPEQLTYFKTFKEAKAFLNRWNRTWVRA
jgi:hypothetical protein